MIQRRLAFVRELLEEAEPLRGLSVGQLASDRKALRAAERDLELMAEGVLDIASHILGARFESFPETNEALLDELTHRGVLSDRLRQRLEGFARLRNVLVHASLVVDPERIHEHLDAAARDLPDFVCEVSAWLEGDTG